MDECTVKLCVEQNRWFIVWMLGLEKIKTENNVKSFKIESKFYEENKNPKVTRTTIKISETICIYILFFSFIGLHLSIPRTFRIVV